MPRESFNVAQWTASASVASSDEGGSLLLQQAPDHGLYITALIVLNPIATDGITGHVKQNLNDPHITTVVALVGPALFDHFLAVATASGAVQVSYEYDGATSYQSGYIYQYPLSFLELSAQASSQSGEIILHPILPSGLSS
jgi:hypothetical protein